MTKYDDAERTARYLEGAAPGSMESDKYAAALIRRLRDERDEARNKALDEAIAALRDFADMTDLMGGKGSQELRIAASSILALKSQEPEKP